MNELISRKSAKNAIYKVCLFEGNKDIFVKILDEINKLSSIEQEPSGDLISRQAVIDACEQSINILEAVDRIMDLPSVEQEPKTGHWIESNIPNEKYVCSECGGACWYYDYQGDVAKSRYCPNCGAKMVEPQESEDKECTKKI